MKLLVIYVVLAIFCGIINTPDRAVAQPIPDPFYPSNEALKEHLQQLSNTHATIVEYQELGLATHGSQPIMALKISDNVTSTEDEPVWIFTGIIHGREQLGLRILYDLANELAAGYGMDSDITNWINAYEIWLVMSINPWGYEHDSSGNLEPTGTRKNGPTVSSSSASGVDLNRNYDFRWSNGGSGSPTSSNFRGTKAFSESETKSIRDLYLNRRPVFGVTFHQGTQPDGGLIMRPWSTSSVSRPPDSMQLFSYASRYADWVFDARSTGPLCERDVSGNFVLQDPDGTSCGNVESSATFCAELCWRPALTTLSAIGQSSNWYYAATGAIDFTVELSDRLFNGSFLHTATGPTTPFQQTIKDVATEFANNHREAIKSWFQHFLFSEDPSQFQGPGLTGHITDAETGLPLSAAIEVSELTSDLIADRVSDASFGRYWRLMPPGTYSLAISAIGYDSWQGDVTVENDGPLTELNVALNPQVTGVEVAVSSIPDVYRLSPAYPNPFNAQTRFILTVAANQYVEIDIYNILGKKVASLYKDMLAAGKSHVFQFDANTLSSGLYMIVIQGENFKTTKMATLVK